MRTVAVFPCQLELQCHIMILYIQDMQHPNHFTLKMIFSPSLLVDFIHSREWCLQPVNLSHLTCPAAIAGLLQVHQLERYASGIRYSNMTYYDLPGRPGHVLLTLGACAVGLR